MKGKRGGNRGIWPERNRKALSEAKILNAFLDLIFTFNIGTHEHEVSETWEKVWSKEDTPMEKYLTREHLNTLDRLKSKWPGRMHPQVLRETPGTETPLSPVKGYCDLETLLNTRRKKMLSLPQEGKECGFREMQSWQPHFILRNVMEQNLLEIISRSMRGKKIPVTGESSVWIYKGDILPNQPDSFLWWDYLGAWEGNSEYYLSWLARILTPSSVTSSQTNWESTG